MLIMDMPTTRAIGTCSKTAAPHSTVNQGLDVQQRACSSRVACNESLSVDYLDAVAHHEGHGRSRTSGPQPKSELTWSKTEPLSTRTC